MSHEGANKWWHLGLFRNFQNEFTEVCTIWIRTLEVCEGMEGKFLQENLLLNKLNLENFESGAVQADMQRINIAMFMVF